MTRWIVHFEMETPDTIGELPIKKGVMELFLSDPTLGPLIDVATFEVEDTTLPPTNAEIFTALIHTITESVKEVARELEAQKLSTTNPQPNSEQSTPGGY